MWTWSFQQWHLQLAKIYFSQLLTRFRHFLHFCCHDVFLIHIAWTKYNFITSLTKLGKKENSSENEDWSYSVMKLNFVNWNWGKTQVCRWRDEDASHYVEWIAVLYMPCGHKSLALITDYNSNSALFVRSVFVAVTMCLTYYAISLAPSKTMLNIYFRKSSPGFSRCP